MSVLYVVTIEPKDGEFPTKKGEILALSSLEEKIEAAAKECFGELNECKLERVN